jgi:hypothetical protein
MINLPNIFVIYAYFLLTVIICNTCKNYEQQTKFFHDCLLECLGLGFLTKQSQNALQNYLYTEKAIR